ncbi:BTAD domain-containing putative transcriptional regulator [Nocardiopsis sp. MG754419]|uniref:AfsR/SARP family transcriptional regulator n=1 Tax=Nocardiopsis sp. MG754419 TaxID=2259865 RepID=UPI001BAD2EA4|nr:BTAD domain-containing putative transcriptional regulator [Nocardiopsis sp. MG754419]MBR8744951.1 AfsR/SARP family transcriptional regulator [Nocardiopsis sp. MG754419]
MWFSILGPLQVVDPSGAPVGVGGARLRTLLVLLLLRPGRPVALEQLTDAIWGEDVPVGAGNALQALASRLRRALGPEARLLGDGVGYRLEVAPDQVDLHVFEDRAGRGRADLTAGRFASAARALDEAITLWRGPALPDLTSRGLAEEVALRLGEAYRTAIEDHLECQVALGRATEAVPRAEALVAADPHRERPVELLMRALAGSGRVADALGVHTAFRTRLAEDLGLDPTPRLGRVHLDLLRGESLPDRAEGAGSRVSPGPAREGSAPSDPDPSDPVPSVGGAETTPPMRLPRHLTDFVARDTEVTAAVERLSGSRMVTLTGPGGAGKTRLASESAVALAGRTPALASGGVWWVELAPVRHGADLPRAVEGALAPREFPVLKARTGTGRQSSTDRIAAHLGERPCLLVLDNCEHLVEGAARFVESLLARCPGVRVLATSREPLGLPGEALLPVPSLDLPPEGADVDRALSCSAVELFTARAEAARSGFRLTDANVAHVVRITRALDGMPLALELAAARLRVMSAGQLAERLSDRFRLLTNGSRSALPRHRTLRAVVDWSWELLGEPERRLLRRLSVFPAGAGLDAVERVAADPDGSPGRVGGEDVWTTLFSLVDKSLVVAESPVREDAPPTYRQLETVRAYASERLAESGERERVREAHARHVVDLWRRADPELRGPGQRSWLARLDAEVDDCAVAFHWAVECGDVELALDLVEHAQWYLTLDGRWRQVHRWSEQVLELAGERVPPGREVAYASCLFHRTGEMTAGRAVLLERLNRVEEVLESGGVRVEDHPVLFPCLIYRAMADGRRDSPARSRVEAAIGQHAHPWNRAMVSLLAAQLDMVFGDARRARERAEIALTGMRECGDVWGQCNALVQLVDVNMTTDLERCRVLLGEGLDLAESAGLEGPGQLFRALRIQVLIELGDLTGAEHELRFLQDDVAEDEQRVSHHMSRIMWLEATGDVAGARRLFDRTDPLVRGLGGFAPVYIEPAWRTMSAEIARSEGDLDRAWREAGRAWWVSRNGSDVSGLAALETLARLTVDQDPKWAAELLGYTAGLRGVADTASTRVRELRALLIRALGETEAARLVARGRDTPRDRIPRNVERWLEPIVPDDVDAGDRRR